MKTKEIMERIHKHLKRMEEDLTINTLAAYRGMKTSRFFGAAAGMSGRWPYLQYVSYQGAFTITKEQAIAYLAWLDAGNSGTHWEAERSAE